MSGSHFNAIQCYPERDFPIFQPKLSNFPTLLLCDFVTLQSCNLTTPKIANAADFKSRLCNKIP